MTLSNLGNFRCRTMLSKCGVVLALLFILVFYLIWKQKDTLYDTVILRPSEFCSNKGQQSANSSGSALSNAPESAMEGVRYFNPSLKCLNVYHRTRRELRGQFWVFYNYVRPLSRNYTCDESITYTTHGDYSFLDNLEPLLKRWGGPVSMSVYAPGSDFYAAIKAIYYFRECIDSKIVKEYATFHLFFDTKHLPVSQGKGNKFINDFATESGSFNCDNILKDVIQSSRVLYKKEKKLVYPVNVARNVARLESTTYFVFPSDVELYPSVGLIPGFLAMIRKNEDPALSRPNPRVFVNSIFEIDASEKKIPESKAELIKGLEKGTVIPFHKKICPHCHSIPKAKEWRDESLIVDEMKVFHTAKRQKDYYHWEPIYIGSNEEPLYDERLSWEGQADKMAQGYKMCIQDYDFHILSNAFLIHRPGIKYGKVYNAFLHNKMAEQNHLISTTIAKEISLLYGDREECRMM